MYGHCLGVGLQSPMSADSVRVDSEVSPVAFSESRLPGTTASVQLVTERAIGSLAIIFKRRVEAVAKTFSRALGLVICGLDNLSSLLAGHTLGAVHLLYIRKVPGSGCVKQKAFFCLVGGAGLIGFIQSRFIIIFGINGKWGQYLLFWGVTGVSKIGLR